MNMKEKMKTMKNEEWSVFAGALLAWKKNCFFFFKKEDHTYNLSTEGARECEWRNGSIPQAPDIWNIVNVCFHSRLERKGWGQDIKVVASTESYTMNL